MGYVILAGKRERKGDIWRMARVVFYHHSRNLYDRFDPAAVNKADAQGSGLWCADARANIGNTGDLVYYSFAVEDPDLLVLNRPLSEDQHARLLSAADRLGNTRLARQLEEKGTDFRPGDDADFKLDPDNRAAVVAAGFDGIDGTEICFLNYARIGSFLPVDMRGAHAAALDTALARIADIEDPEATLAAALPDTDEGRQIRQSFEDAGAAVAQMAEAAQKPAAAAGLRQQLAGFYLQALSDDAEAGRPDNVNPLRMFTAAADRVLNLYAMRETYVHRGWTRDSEHYGMIYAPAENSGGAAMEKLRAALSQGIEQTDSLYHAPAAPAAAMVVSAAPPAAAESKFAAFAAAPVPAAPVSSAASVEASPAVSRFVTATGPYTIDNLFPEEGRGQGLKLPAGADDALRAQAQKLVAALNDMHRETGQVSGMLRDSLVKNTARLADPPSDPHYQHDAMRGDMTRFGHVRDQINGADYLRHELAMLRLSPSPAAQAAGEAMQGFMQSFAKTAGASAYSMIALQDKPADVEAEVRKLSSAGAPKHAACKM